MPCPRIATPHFCTPQLPAQRARHCWSWLRARSLLTRAATLVTSQAVLVQIPLSSVVGRTSSISVLGGPSLLQRPPRRDRRARVIPVHSSWTIPDTLLLGTRL